MTDGWRHLPGAPFPYWVEAYYSKGRAVVFKFAPRWLPVPPTHPVYSFAVEASR